MNEYTTIDIQRIFGIDRQRLREWIDKRYIFPSINQASGVGTKNIFSRWDMYGIEIFRLLIETGFSRKAAKEVYHYWSLEFNPMEVEYSNNLSYILIIHNLRPHQLKQDENFDELQTFVITKEKANELSISLIEKDFPNLTRWELMDITRIIKDVDRKLS